MRFGPQWACWTLSFLKSSALVGLSYCAYSSLCVNPLRSNGSPSHRRRYLRYHHQLGQHIGSFQTMQGEIADRYVALNAARDYVHEAALACDAGRLTRQGAAGSVVSRSLRDAKLMEIWPGTSEIRRMLIGRQLMEIAR